MSVVVGRRCQAGQPEPLPLGTGFGIEREISKAQLVGRAFHLHVTAGAEVHRPAGRRLEHQFANERRQHARRADPAFPALHAQHRFRDPDGQVPVHGDLAGEAHTGLAVPAVDVRGLGGQQRSAAGRDRDAALPAGAAAAAGRGQEQAVAGQRLEQARAARGLDDPLVVDGDLHRAARQDPGARQQHQQRQRHHDRREQAGAEQEFLPGRVHSSIPPSVRKARDMSPAVMKVMPSPRRPAGGSA